MKASTSAVVTSGAGLTTTLKERPQVRRGGQQGVVAGSRLDELEVAIEEWVVQAWPLRGALGEVGGGRHRDVLSARRPVVVRGREKPQVSPAYPRVVLVVRVSTDRGRKLHRFDERAEG